MIEFYREVQLVTPLAETRLVLGERLIEAGRRAEGEAEVRQALDFFRSVDATYFIERGEALLASSAYSDSA